MDHVNYISTATRTETLPLPNVDKIVHFVKCCLKKDVNMNIKRRVFAFNGDKQDLIFSEIKKLEQCGSGIFSLQREAGRQKNNSRLGVGLFYLHRCERSTAPKGKSDGLPFKTRANNCNAYVSHVFYTVEGVQICVQRMICLHNGHSLENSVHGRKNRICPELKEQICYWFSLDYKISQVLNRAVSWAKSNGYFDENDRRYYPSAIDLKHLKKKYKLYRNQFEKRDEVTYETTTSVENYDVTDHTVEYDRNYTTTLENLDTYHNYAASANLIRNDLLSNHDYSAIMYEPEVPPPPPPPQLTNRDKFLNLLDEIRETIIAKPASWQPTDAMIEELKKLHTNIFHLFETDVMKQAKKFRRVSVKKRLRKK